MQYVNRKTKLSENEKTQRQLSQQKHEDIIRLRNNRMGIAIFQVSWMMVFVCLVVVYWQMGFQPGWRPTPAQAPNAILPTFATIGLLLSAWFCRRALKTVEHTDPQQRFKYPPFARDWLLAIGLGAAFFVVMMAQFFAIPAGSVGHEFGTIYRVMIGYHALHAFVIGFMLVQVWRFGQDGRYHQANSWSVEAATKLWYFVVAAWLLFYAVLYLPFLG